MKQIFHIFFLIVQIVVFASPTPATLPLIKEVITTFGDAIETSCFTLAHTRQQLVEGKDRIVNTLKDIILDPILGTPKSQNYFPTMTTMTFAYIYKLAKSKTPLFNCKNPVVLVIHDDEDTRRQLVTVSYIDRTFSLLV